MIGGAIIGRHHDADLRYINDPISEYYIPYPDTISDCDELNNWDSALTAQIEFWNTTLQSETNGIAISNVQQIITIQTDKQARYKAKIAATCAITPPPGGAGTGTGTGTEPKNSSMVWIIAAAAGALILFGGKIFGKKKSTK